MTDPKDAPRPSMYLKPHGEGPGTVAGLIDEIIEEVAATTDFDRAEVKAEVLSWVLGPLTRKRRGKR